MKFRIGTRRSRLALAQAGEVAQRLARLGIETELVPMSTAGDRGAPATASDAGVKGLFVAEIVQALVRGDVDLAVHSAKDLPAEDAEGVIVGAVPPRADPFDVVVTREPGALADGASVGTSMPMSKTVSILPFGSASFAHTRAALKVNGTSTSGSDNYAIFGMGAGFQFSPNLVVRPSLSLLAGADQGVDNTIFGLSLSWGVGH